MSKSQSVAPEGRPTHTPKIRIAGVTAGSPQFVALVDQYRGALGQFMRASQTQVALGKHEQYAATKAVPGGSMTYHNNQGQETITLKLDTVEGAGEEPPRELDEYWKWLIVEMVVPNIQGESRFNAGAFMTPPPKNKHGYTQLNIAGYDEDNLPLGFPTNTEFNFPDVQDNNGYVSLRLDLRPYPGGAKFDIYCSTERYQDGTTKDPTPTGVVRAMYQGVTGGPYNTATCYTSAGTPLTGWYDASAIGARTPSDYFYRDVGTPRTTPDDIALSFPALPGPFTATSSTPPSGAPDTDGGGYAGLSFVWTPGHGTDPDPATMNISALISAGGGLFSEVTTVAADGVSYSVRGLGVRTYNNSGDTFGAGPVDSDGAWGISFYDYTIYYVGVHPDVPVYVYPDRDCPLSFAVMDDMPDANANHYGSPLRQNSYRWENSKTFPTRWPMKLLATPHVAAIANVFVGGPPTGHWGLQKIGTIIVNPRKGKGGIKFVAA